VELDEAAKVDYSKLKGQARAKERRKQESPTIAMVRECDQGVVSLACNEFEVSIYVMCAFPTEYQAYALAVRANNIACRKIGRNYAIPQNSLYYRIVSLFDYTPPHFS
jgi:hypothetical protein